MGSGLEEVASAAEEVAEQQRDVAVRVRQVQRQRARGVSWGAILDREAAPGLLGLLRQSTRRLGDATRRFALTLAKGLASEGESRRQIARRLGVTHQRISAMLNSDRRK